MAISMLSVAQEEVENPTPTLGAQFGELKEGAETYAEYKVIKISKLNAFWQTVQDSIGSYKAEVGALQSSLTNQQAQIDQLNDKIGELQASLDDANFYRERISFLGLPMVKETYNIITWGIVLGLAILAVVLYLGYKRSHKVTKERTKDFKELTKEFDSFRQRAQSREVKLGRELQTLRNSNEELRGRGASRRERASQ
jgi:uncharacterized protein YlxW (UPF0749 family)